MTNRRHITATFRMDDQHDERAIRQLLKMLKRKYDLVCVGLEGCKCAGCQAKQEEQRNAPKEETTD